jgi:transcriptional regulator with XRE-family HTH domain
LLTQYPYDDLKLLIQPDIRIADISLMWKVELPPQMGGVAVSYLMEEFLQMNVKVEGHSTTGKRLRAWRKSVPLKLMELSRLIKVSQGSLSDLENDKSLPSATTLSNLAIFTDLNIYWLLNGRGPVTRELVPETDKSAEKTRLYEDYMYMMQDRKLKGVVDTMIKIYSDGDAKKKAQIQGFLSALS